MTIKYPVYKPFLSGNEKKYVNECLDSSWISSQGEFIERFETGFANYLGVNYARSCSNGTTALHLALLALQLKPGDEVILPSLTYVASANAVSYIGATPVFVDSESTFFQLDPDQVEALITPQTKAIMAVHLYGHAVNMEKLLKICKKHGLHLIEDCAEAIGTQFQQQYVGTFGDIATFSFFGNKTITTGEGGMVVTNNPELAERVSHYKGQGLAKNHRYFHDVIGYNYRMTNICCAIGLAQLENIDIILQKKLNIANWYKQFIDGSKMRFHEQQENTVHSYWLVSILAKNGEERDQLMNYLLLHGIDSRPFFVPMHHLPIYEQSIQLPVAEELSACGINLPSYPGLEEEDVRYISLKINEWLNLREYTQRPDCLVEISA